ncbi:pseudouridine synthase [Duganella violaceipulchra]|uniref:Pseudouridine synthase n=1 Tax=Duganella violaceipulchra TaxID=2849652 RepID=A0AA41L3P5_9BURK|nr:pseudouridine synthase [Duganella violaceicalia]MBV6324223.1 pseudouridine synthase [Duganella violaceicalia]MCP2011844.1 tRNA pseudouridine32 synthase/23S rRNA pseudouridine746 synthase [Duganella violaceicalia]
MSRAPLPMRDGVAPSYLWLPEGQWPDLLTFLIARYPDVTEASWRDRMARREVMDGDGNALAPHSAYRRGMRIFYYRELDAETPIPFEEEVLFMDEHLVVVDKPHFLPMIPTGRFLHETLLVRLKKKLGEQDLTPIHRLDRETAGVVIFSRRQDSRGAYQSMFQKRVIEKEYEALAPRLQGREFPFTYRSRMVDGDKFFIMKEEVGEPNSETLIDVIEHRADCTLYRLHPHTGRKHQLRVHLSSLGIPIINDAFYPVALPCKQDDVSQPLKLLARRIAFTDPLSGERREFHSRRSL